MKFLSIWLFIAIFSASASAQNCRRTKMRASGATFPESIYDDWLKRLKKNPTVNYKAVGSSAGIADFKAGKVDFAGTDSPLSAKELKKGKGVQFPTVGSGVAIAHNNNGCKKLRLSQREACDLFLGKKKWSDFGCRCAKNEITVVVRSDGSGTTDVFTKSLSAFCRAFKKKVGSGKEVKWLKSFVARKGNSGVAKALKSNKCAIGYVGFGTARSAKLKVAAIENKDGKFVSPSSKSISAGLGAIKLSRSTCSGSDPNPKGKSSYPIVMFTCIVAKKTGNGSKAECIQKALKFFLSKKMQGRAAPLGFAPLPGKVARKSLKVVGKIKK